MQLLQQQVQLLFQEKESNMNKIFFKITGVILTLSFTLGSITAKAEQKNDIVYEAQSLVDGIIDFKLSQTDSSTVQEWIDGALTENAGKSSEWYIFSLSRYGDFDFSGYESALLSFLGQQKKCTASSALKYALVLASVGSSDSYISETVNSATGKQGVMSYIYGLHLLNNGYGNGSVTADETIGTLLGMQTSDGGWAITGDIAETDATAMAIQALAPHYEENETVRKAVDNALILLSGRQLEGGDYASYGVSNPESTCQVLTALTSLGIDPMTDERFIKNGNNLIDGLKIYHKADGSFSHEKDKEYNENATVQTFYSLISYIRFSESKSPLYILEDESETITQAPPVTSDTDKEPATDIDAKEEEIPEKTAETDYRLPVCLVISGAAVVAAVVLILVKKGKKQNLIAVGAIAAAGIIFVLVTDFRGTEDYYGSVTKKDNPVGTVTISIRCDTIVGKSDEDYIPDDGIILNDSFEIEKNETVFDILVEAAKKHSVQLDYSGTAGTVYISGINYIYEFDFGDLSGWMYLVNGEKSSVGCDGYVLSDGDFIEWLYSCEMGNDLT